MKKVIKNGRIENSNGDVMWYENGVLHREERDGAGHVLPAIDLRDGGKEWWVMGGRHRDGGLPAVEYRDGSRYWFENGLPHRIGGPALESADGKRQWYKRGLRHRMDGPAVVVVESGVVKEEWFIEGVRVEKELHPWWVSEQEKKRLSDAMAMTAPSMSVNCSGDVCISDVVLNDESKKNKKKFGL